MTDEREKARLAKPPFETMVSVSDEVKNELRGWKPPKDRAYILFQSKNYEYSRERWYEALFTLDVDGRPEQASRVDYYVMQKGYRIIHYGNFPKPNHPNPAIAKKAQMHIGSDMVNPWDDLENHVKRYMGIEAKQTAKETALLEQLKAAQEKNEALTKSAKGKKTDPNE